MEGKSVFAKMPAAVPLSKRRKAGAETKETQTDALAKAEAATQTLPEPPQPAEPVPQEGEAGPDDDIYPSDEDSMLLSFMDVSPGSSPEERRPFKQLCPTCGNLY